MQTPELQSQMEKFTSNLQSRIGNEKMSIFNPGKSDEIYYKAFGDNILEEEVTLPYGDELEDVKVENIDEPYMEELDSLIGSQVNLPDKSGIPLLITVKKRKRESQGHPVGKADDNPILDSRIYELEYPDGRVEEYSVNTILENMVEQVHSNDWDTTLMDEILAVRRDSDVSVMQGPDASAIVNGRKRPIITTKGWDVQVRWKDGSISWHPLFLVKRSNPVDLTKYVESNGLSKEPAFRWWIKQVLKRRGKIKGKFKTKKRKNKIKYGIKVPATVEETRLFDTENGDALWQDAINKEMANSRISFEVLEEGENAPVGYTQITCHLISDV